VRRLDTLPCLPQVYLLHPLFEDEMLAFLLVSFFSFVSAFLGFSYTFVASQIEHYTHHHNMIAASTQNALQFLSPTFLALKLLFRVMSVPKDTDMWQWEEAGQCLTWLAVQACVYVAVGVFMSTGSPRSFRAWLRRLRGCTPTPPSVLCCDAIARPSVLPLQHLSRPPDPCLSSTQAHIRQCPHLGVVQLCIREPTPL
jgi:hypothetical protein